MEEPRFDPLDYVSVFNRRKWWFIVPVAVSIVVGVALVWTLPRSYDSYATVGVSAPRVIAANLGGGSAQAERTDRLRAIQQQLLSRPVLERTAQLEGLAKNGSVDAAISRIRSRVRVAASSSITPGSSANSLSAEARAQLDAYQLSYSDGSAEDAQRILNRIANVFVEETMKSREVRAQDTSAFIAMQVAASEERLNSLEERLRQAKEAYMGRLPEQTNSNLAMVESLNRQIEAAATQMRGEQDRLSSIERQIEALEQGSDIGVVTSNTPMMSVQARVIQLRAELAEARMSFTDKHPEIVRLNDELQIAERLAVSERERPAEDRRSVLSINPQYRQLVRDRDSARFRIGELQRLQTNATNGIRQYRQRVDSAPRVEQELQSLTREYDLERANYTDLQQKRQAAALNEQLQRGQGVEQFAVLVPASYPNTPTSPKPMRLMLMALAAGLVIGGAGVMGREYLDRSVHDARGLRDQFELPVLAEIPRIDPVVS
jgi:polysaccharide chain length determinant protein (PEP-CTERM system associated)